MSARLSDRSGSGIKDLLITSLVAFARDLGNRCNRVWCRTGLDRSQNGNSDFIAVGCVEKTGG